MTTKHVETVADPRGFKRISWGAVFAGTVVALVTQMLLTVLGIGVGASTIDPVTEQNPAAGLGMGAGIWSVVSTLIALFAGGWVAGRLAGVPGETDSRLHGILTWATTTLITFYLLTTAVGAIVSGAAGVLGKGLAMTGRGIAAVAPQISEATGMNQMDINSLKEEARQLLRDTGKPELQPQNLNQEAQEAGQAANQTAAAAGQNPQAAEAELMELWDRIVAKGGNVIEAADRDALINVVEARTNQTREEAAATVARWEQTYREMAAQFQQTKEQLGQKTKEVTSTAAEGIAKTAIWTFVVFLLGAIAAAIGGTMGTPAPVIATRTEHTV